MDAHRTPHAVRRGELAMALVDGDGLAYTQSGPAGTSRAQAVQNLHAKLGAVERLCQCPTAIVLTMPGSSKGGRYAIATVKPYQGQRSSGRRPENWEHLRGVLEEARLPWPVYRTFTAEADDLFSKAALTHGGNIAIVTQDKDMRMIPAMHVTWDEHMLVDTRRDRFDSVVWEKQYGTKWLWLQMLQGDGADNIPGLPKYRNAKGTLALCGEVTAGNLLAGVPEEAVYGTVLHLYRGFYGELAEQHMLEQAALLWMRQNPEDPLDVCRPGNPLHPLLGTEHTLPLLRRVQQAKAV